MGRTPEQQRMHEMFIEEMKWQQSVKSGKSVTAETLRYWSRRYYTYLLRQRWQDLDFYKQALKEPKTPEDIKKSMRLKRREFVSDLWMEAQHTINQMVEQEGVNRMKRFVRDQHWAVRSSRDALNQRPYGFGKYGVKR